MKRSIIYLYILVALIIGAGILDHRSRVDYDKKQLEIMSYVLKGNLSHLKLSYELRQRINKLEREPQTLGAILR